MDCDQSKGEEGRRARIEEVCGGPYVTQLDLTMDNFPLGFWTGKLFNIKLIVFRQMEHMKCQHFRQGNLLLLQQGRGGGEMGKQKVWAKRRHFSC